MITKFQRSWELFKASITITFRYPKLLWFPFLTTIMTAFIALFFLSAMAIPLVIHHTGYHLDQKEHWLALKDYYLPAQPANTAAAAPVAQANGTVIHPPVGHPIASRDSLWRAVFLLPVYFVSMFLATFFNVAFYSEIIAALNGKGVSFRRGLGVARSRLPSILAWSILADPVTKNSTVPE